ncbi:MAG: hypothetical protein WC980_04935 [Candidatus Brocadiia bacterium]
MEKGFIAALGANVSDIARIQGEIYSPLLKEKRFVDIGEGVKPPAYFVPSKLSDAPEFLRSLEYFSPVTTTRKTRYQTVLKFTFKDGSSKKLYFTPDGFISADRKNVCYSPGYALLELDMETVPYHPMTNYWKPEWSKIKMATPDAFFPYILRECKESLDPLFPIFAVRQAFKGPGKGSWEYIRRLKDKIMAKIRNEEYKHDLSYLVHVLGQLKARDEILKLIAESDYHDCCFEPALMEELANCGKPEDIPVLINQIGKEGEGGREAANKALCKLTGQKASWTKTQWQEWYDKNNGKGK